MTGHRWQFMLRPRGLAWHAIAVVAFFGMLWLGDWQLRRAEAGNELSWAYTFEWPLFAAFGVYFWIRSIREELRLAADRADVSRAAAGAGPPESADAYAARLRAEVRGHGKW